MKKILKRLLKGITPLRVPRKDITDEWLGQSVDLVDLETRMKRLDRGQAPFHVQQNHNLKHWV